MVLSSRRASKLLNKCVCRLYSKPAASQRIVNYKKRPADEPSTSKSDENQSENASKDKRLEMIPPWLHNHLFPDSPVPENSACWPKNMQIPPLKGSNLAGHFQRMGEEKSLVYKAIMDNFVWRHLPRRPKDWKLQKGWTRYSVKAGSGAGEGMIFAAEPVTHPKDLCLVFDVEVCVTEGHQPVMAVAVSDVAWYLWCSDRLFDPESNPVPSCLSISDLIPMEGNDDVEGSARIVIGHNVAYDRARVKEQYCQKRSGLRFWDTMSMHIAVCGMTADQRITYSKNELSSEQHWLNEWRSTVSYNGLLAAHRLHCPKRSLDLDKGQVKTFIDGNIHDVRRDFMKLVDYCADDAAATFELFQVVWRLFQERFPHPITMSGMLEMGTAYLPVNYNWKKFISKADGTQEQLEKDVNDRLMQIAVAVKNELQPEHKWQDDPWMWCEDWRGKDKPSWFSKLIDTKLSPAELLSDTDPAHLITMRREVIPRLLRLTWNGYPLHKRKGHGWGCLVPTTERYIDGEVRVRTIKNGNVVFPLRRIQEFVASNKSAGLCTEPLNPKLKVPWLEKFNVPCDFYKLPHLSGFRFNVGNPLSKPFFKYIDQGLLRSNPREHLEFIAKTSNRISYWTANKKRVHEQMVVWKDEHESADQQGVILPHIVPAGTVTRRAVEKTWMTMSNPRSDRVGSELKSMVQAPPGYCFVGADVDSQEQWIAAILGDYYTNQGNTGATEFSRMLLQGSKSLGTDLHSRVANLLQISRDAAKEYLPQADEAVIREKVKKLFKSTKGIKKKSILLGERASQAAKKFNLLRNYSGKYWEILGGRIVLQMSPNQYRTSNLFRDLNVSQVRLGTDCDFNYSYWHGGYESEVFNCLESIISSSQPQTPVLGAQLSRALCLPTSDANDAKEFGREFLRSRINWVVQSSAVDFLHLLLTSMASLCQTYEIDARFVISIHDEIRYLVAWPDRYRCAYALHLSNLFTRAMVSHSLGIQQMPLSIAFFGQVDIDQVLRKEPNLECQTPSNPGGLLEEYGIGPGESVTLERLREVMELSLDSNAVI